MIDWCPFAQRDQIPDRVRGGVLTGAGPMQGGQPKILHHTTEGGTYSGARGAYASTHDLPHFTDTFENGTYVVFQHLPLSVAATALEHHGGITNTDNVIQIEHVGFAASSGGWPPGYLAGIARLCRWIEAQTGCPPTCGVSFQGAVYGPWPGRMTWDAWNTYAGHLGHCHAPSNDHYDPGPINIGAILATPQPVVQPASPQGGETMHLSASIQASNIRANGTGWIDVAIPSGYAIISVLPNGSDAMDAGGALPDVKLIPRAGPVPGCWRINFQVPGPLDIRLGLG